MPKRKSASDEEDFDDEDDLTLSHFLPQNVTFNDYAAVDDIMQICKLLTDEDIVASMLSDQRTDEASKTVNSDDDDKDTASKSMEEPRPNSPR